MCESAKTCCVLPGRFLCTDRASFSVWPQNDSVLVSFNMTVDWWFPDMVKVPCGRQSDPLAALI